MEETLSIKITPEIKDAAGEICNQIFGQTKLILNQQGHSIEMALPTVVEGKDHSITHLNDGTCIVVEFQTPRGSLWVEAAVKKK